MMNLKEEESDVEKVNRVIRAGAERTLKSELSKFGEKEDHIA